MRVITRRDRIRGAPKSWEQQYRDWTHDREKQETTKRLLALDTETCDRSAVDQIIGNSSWTNIQCGECDTDVETAVMFEDCEDQIVVCGPCLERALELLDGDPNASQSE